MPPGPVISCSRRNRGRNTKGTKKILLCNKAATFSFLDKVFGAAHSPPRRGGVSATSKKMDPFRLVADGVVSSARLRRPAELTTNYGFALSRSRFAPVCASFVASRHFLDGAATPPLRGGEYDAFKFRPNGNVIGIWLRRSRAVPFVVRSLLLRGNTRQRVHPSKR